MISTIIKYFRFGGTNAPKLMRGMGWTLLTSFFESWQMMALAVVLSSLAANASAGPAGNTDMGQSRWWGAGRRRSGGLPGPHGPGSR